MAGWIASRAVRAVAWVAAAAPVLALPACTGTGGPGAVAVASPASCQIRYAVRAQPAGFTADVTVTNRGAGRLGDPAVGFHFTGTGQHLAAGWNATWSQSQTRVTAEISGAGLASGASMTVGFDGLGPAGPVPTGFTLNGVGCPVTVDSDAAVAAAAPTAPALHVSGNQIVDQAGHPASLVGVNRSGGEYRCVHGDGVWDGPVDDAAIAAIASWSARAVRLPLNEDCWLSLAGVPSRDSGARYRNAVATLVARLEAHGLTPILDLHWSEGAWTGAESQCSDVAAACQKPMPDAAHAVPFWRSVAQTFRDDPAVVFDLYNEPYPSEIGVVSRDRSWDCWLAGGASCGALSYPAAGMQQLVDAVRSTGARNVILASANSYARDLTGWLAHRPVDPTGNLAAAWHWYDDGFCPDVGCWQRQVATVAARVPVVATELGETDCASTSVVPLMAWLDAQHVDYLAWAWDTWDCREGPALITSYSGNPTPYGAGIRDHLRGR